MTATARIDEILAATPPALLDRVRKLAGGVVEQGQVARKEVAAPHPEIGVRVVGGDKAPPGTFLHCACLGGAARWACSGALIAPQLVLSAGHCQSVASKVMVGSNSVKPLGQDARVIPVRKAIVHPRYQAYPLSECDLMLLILDTPAMNPSIPLATIDDVFDAEAFDIVGFGMDDPDDVGSFGDKRRAKIPFPAIIGRPGDDLGSLPETLGFHPDYEFVAGRKNLGIDSCNGDSGGPIYVSVAGVFKLAGLTSRATRTALAGCGDGGIYLQPRKFLDWINSEAAAENLGPVN